MRFKKRQLFGLFSIAFLLIFIIGCGSDTEWRSIAVSSKASIRYRQSGVPSKNHIKKVALNPSGGGWAVGDGLVLKYEHKKWDLVGRGLIGQDAALNSVSVVDDEDAWFVGSKAIFKSGGSIEQKPMIVEAREEILHETELDLDNNLSSVSMISSREGWAGGDYGLLLRFNGSLWNVEPFPLTSHIWDLLFADAGLGWALSGTSLVEYGNGRWSVNPEPLRPYPKRLLERGDGTLVVGGMEWLLIIRNGSRQYVEGMESAEVSCMAEDSRGGIWIVGGDPSGQTGVIAYLYEGTLSSNRVDFPEYLNGIAIDDNNHGWICGNNGTMLEIQIEYEL
jgi:hypothetical protein